MNESDKSIKVIKHHEGVRTTPYKCQALLWTIGVGHEIGGEVSVLFGGKVRDGAVRPSDVNGPQSVSAGRDIEPPGRGCTLGAGLCVCHGVLIIKRPTDTATAPLFDDGACTLGGEGDDLSPACNRCVVGAVPKD